MARKKISADGALYGRGIIIEMIAVGQFMKVSAFDERSLTEVSISGPVTTPTHILQSNALKRLEYVLRKQGLID